MILVSGLRLPLGSGEQEAVAAGCKLIGLSRTAVISGRLFRLSYDARHGSVSAVCSVLLALADEKAEADCCARNPEAKPYTPPALALEFGQEKLSHRPVVVGFGPAGLFAAYLLALYGYRPLVLERGREMERRIGDVERFFTTGALEPESNVQFGEGGAGTFSDGKLTTRIHDPYCGFVLETLAAMGAPNDILYKAKPHIGTDRLRAVVRNLRAAIIEKGGAVRFGARLDDLRTAGNGLCGYETSGQSIPADILVLACGHSARDTFAMLARRGLCLTTKPFSVGVRIEHLQADIDRALYGKAAGDKRLPPGEYALSAQVNGRGVYTFCMCPGGSVVAASSEAGSVVTNGMSEYARSGSLANSAVAVSVDGRDFANPFDGLEFQRRLEQAAYQAGGGYRAPAQNAASFLEGSDRLAFGRVHPSYPLGVTGASLESIFGREITECLRGGLRAFGKKLWGFDAPDTILTGVETRTSSPLRVERDPVSREAVGLPGLYPCGEGAGYAGGIMSAAVDGIRTALTIMAKYRPFD